MTDVTLEQVIRLAQQLDPLERAKLVESLQKTLPTPLNMGITREEVLAEHARRLAAGAFNNVDSLYGRYARPGLDLSFDDIEAAIHEHSWEDELDQFSADD